MVHDLQNKKYLEMYKYKVKLRSVVKSIEVKRDEILFKKK